MKKALKITGKVLKWYMILDTLYLAFVGASRCLKEYRKYPEKSINECNVNVCNKAVNQYKKYFNW